MDLLLLLADDDASYRKLVRVWLKSQPGLTLVGEATDGQEAVNMALELNPDAILMDITMPNLNGIEATRQILSSCPHIRVIALSMHSDPQFKDTMLKAGASAYIQKENLFQDLWPAIRAFKPSRTNRNSVN